MPCGADISALCRPFSGISIGNKKLAMTATTAAKKVPIR